MVRVIRLIKAFLRCLMSYITYAIIQIGLGNVDSPGAFALALSLLLISGLPVVRLSMVPKRTVT